MGTLVANKGLQFKVRVENYTNQNITIPLQGWEMNANPTYWGANTNYFSFGLVNPDTGGVYIQAPVVPANNGVIEIGFRVQNILDRNGTNIQNVNDKRTETVSINFRNGMYEGNTSVNVTSMI
ncbi:hypothetical protein [Proteiniphilum acetatigenes]|uniref:hypothetical protein n=1 Tax=Proteiniphilum acetatigenes TaxID=294710 RepID=UPI00035E32D1|nr:hypothetical protein [Proteiniphilum acetatigenes]